MALKLVTNYAKRLGLPGYSSHQFSVTIETELTSTDDIAGESARLYATLQNAVDEEIQQTGFIPDAGYGNHSENPAAHGNTNRASDHQPHAEANGNGSAVQNGNGAWACTDKQRALIEKIVRENDLDKHIVESLAVDLFGHSVKSLNRLAASGLIDELIERYGSKRATNGNGRSRSFDRSQSGRMVRS